MRIMAWLLARLCIILIIDVSTEDWIKEGDTHSFSCNSTNPQTKVITWKVINQTGNDVTLYLCGLTSCVTGFDNPNYNATLSLDGELIQTIVIIKKVSLDMHQTQLKCVFDQQTSTSSTIHDVFVYVSPKNSVCYKPELVKPSNLSIRCRAYRTFPTFLCNFFVKTNEKGPSPVINQTVSYRNLTSNDAHYIDSECNLTISGITLGPGKHQFCVVMYPNISGNIYGTSNQTSNYTDLIAINEPKAVLGQECSYGYFKENEPGRCSCLNENEGFFPTRILWNGIDSDNGTLEFTPTRPSNNVSVSYNCTLTSLIWRNETRYTPKVAYPPDNLTITIFKSDINKCNTSNVNIFGECYVSESYPPPSVRVMINSEQVYSNSKANGTKYIFEKIIKGTGIFNVSCHFNNTAYSNITSTEAIIKGPPEIPYIFANANGEKIVPSANVLAVQGEVDIVCDSTGGFPRTKNFSLTCGNKTEILYTEQDTVKLTNITNGLQARSNLTCICIVNHELRCLLNTTVMLLVIDQRYFAEDFDVIYIGIGVAIGIILLILSIILILTKFRVCQLRNSASYMFEKLVNNSEIYLITKDKSGTTWTDYNNIFSTMTSATEYPKNFKVNY